MEMNLFGSKSVSTSEMVHVGGTYSSLFLSSRDKATVRFSKQFYCPRGIFFTSSNIYLSDKAITSVGPHILAAETNCHGINGINGETSNLYSRNMRVLDAFDDEYGGVVMDTERLPESPSAFAPSLHFSLAHWKKMGKKGIWLKLLVEQSELVPIAVKEGFQYHHAEQGYVMLTYWLPEGPCMLPANASHQVGVGGFVINQNNEVLVVQEKHCAPSSSGLWKIPTGFILEAEEIYTGGIREVKEETEIDSEFVEVIAFRHIHNMAFEKSDLFFICMLRPLSTQIIVEDLEIQAAKWMPLVEFIKQPLIQGDNMFKKVIDICFARLGKHYCGLSVHQMLSKFDGKPSSLYYNVVDSKNINCVGN
ncbi:Nudix family hydrolase [Quillaja saponaria]|uniref:Nudix family hydrolase n=1 Tax=Quillaja saponaria TaxID=32244 RepID=A0AAD7KRZ5_QUISA|nr:Nudix family hydrolase [Quillaja saponaria]KAJ7944706.1 Nudix family hydrolase [Quillaja saponaria]